MGFRCDDFSARRARKIAAMAAMGGGGWSSGRDGPFGASFGHGGKSGSHFGFGGSGGPGGPGGARMRQRGRFTREKLRLVLLALLTEEPRHGYDLIRLIEERSGGQYAPSPGVIYPALAMLADEGLVEEQASDDKRRRYAITEDGRAVLASDAGQVAELMERLGAMGEQAERHRPPQIERAYANLFTAVRQRLREEGGKDLPHDIAEILDEAARRIERL